MSPFNCSPTLRWNRLSNVGLAALLGVVGVTAAPYTPGSSSPGVSISAAPTDSHLPSQAAAALFVLPIAGRPSLLRDFAPPAQDWLPGHRGVDFAAEPGTVIRAPADGVVSFAGVVAGRPALSLRHHDGRVSSFEPVTSMLPAGSTVSSGEAVGHSTQGEHCRSQPCVHWGVRLQGRYVDPLAQHRMVTVRLVPHHLD